MPDYQKLNNFSSQSLKRENLGSHLDFSHINDSLEKIRKTFLFFQNTNATLTQYEHSRLESIFKTYIEILQRITDFRAQSGELTETTELRRNQIVNDVYEIEKETTEFLLPLTYTHFIDKKISELSVIQNSLSSLSKDYTQKLSQFETDKVNSISNFEASFREKISEATKIIQDAKNFSLGKVAEKYGKIFETQAKENKFVALISLGAFMVSIILILYFLCYFFNPIIETLTKNEKPMDLKVLITNIIFRLTLIFIGLLFVKEALKNYNVNMHLYNLNKHRQNALESFDAFVDTPNKSETKDLIVTEIARTIYSVNKIGYLSEDKKSLDLNQAIELLKAIKPL